MPKLSQDLALVRFAKKVFRKLQQSPSVDSSKSKRTGMASRQPSDASSRPRLETPADDGQVARAHNAQQPISMVSDDLLHIIFHNVKDDQLPSGQTATLVTITSVCAAWRHAALSFKDLWNAYRSFYPSEGAHARLKAYLERSGIYPFDIWLDFRSMQLDHPDPDRYQLLAESIKHIDRWKTFTLITEIETPLQHLQKLLRYSEAPLLERLTILSTRLKWKSPFASTCLTTTSPSILTGGAPNLKTLWLNDIAAILCLPSLITITELRLDKIALGRAIYWIPWDLFRQIMALPNLAFLSFTNQPFTYPTREQTAQLKRKLVMRSLVKLRYASTGNTSFVDLILPNLVAPNLKYVSLSGVPLPTNLAFWDMHAPLAPFPKLEVFVMTAYYNFNRPFTERLFELMSKATTVVLSGSWSNDQWGSASGDTINPLGPEIWKGIQTLALDLSSLLGVWAGDPLAQFIIDRKGLERIYVSNRAESPWKAVVNAIEHREEGEGFITELKTRKWTVLEEVHSFLAPSPPGSRPCFSLVDSLVNDHWTFTL